MENLFGLTEKHVFRCSHGKPIVLHAVSDSQHWIGMPFGNNGDGSWIVTPIEVSGEWSDDILDRLAIDVFSGKLFVCGPDLSDLLEFNDEIILRGNMEEEADRASLRELIESCE